jgi:hypothetical protein
MGQIIKCLPIIRHVRYFYHRHKMMAASHYRLWRFALSSSAAAAYVGPDLAKLDRIWRGAA